jgi:hypothetical protein
MSRLSAVSVTVAVLISGSLAAVAATQRLPFIAMTALSGTGDM